MAHYNQWLKTQDVRYAIPPTLASEIEGKPNVANPEYIKAPLELYALEIPFVLVKRRIRK